MSFGICAMLRNSRNRNVTARIKAFASGCDQEEVATIWTAVLQQRLQTLTPDDKSLQKTKNLLDNKEKHLAKKEAREQTFQTRKPKVMLPNLSKLTLQQLQATLGKVAKEVQKLETEAERKERMTKLEEEQARAKEEQAKKDRERTAQYKAKLLAEKTKKQDNSVNVTEVIRAIDAHHAFQAQMRAKRQKDYAKKLALIQAINTLRAKLG